VIRKVVVISRFCPIFEVEPLLRNASKNSSDDLPHNYGSYDQYLERTNAPTVPPPVYSSNLASNDFSPFGFLNDKLRGIALNDKDDLISRVPSNVVA
jgi:hypothetical protein